MRRIVSLVVVVLLTVSAAPVASATDPYDWANQTDHEYANGWVVGPCGGEAPVACIFRNGRWLGVINHGAMPVSDLPDGVEGDQAVLDYVARDILRSFRKDRAIGCPGYEFQASPPASAEVAFSDGRAVGFSLTKDGATTELNTWRLAVEDGFVHWITVGAASPRACLGHPDAPVLSLRAWRTFEDAFDTLASTSLLGPPPGY